VMWIPRYIRRLIVQVALEELTIGGHCGCCGKWVPDHIVETDWPVTLCDGCISEATQQLDITPEQGNSAGIE
jgi:hypothetical protein